MTAEEASESTAANSIDTEMKHVEVNLIAAAVM